MPRNYLVIVWKLENFSFLSKSSQHDEVTSPLFVADNMEKTSWNLLLRTPSYSHSQPGYSNNDEFRFYLSKSSQTGPNTISVRYNISVLTGRGLKNKSDLVNEFQFGNQDNSLGTPLCVPRNEIIGESGILPEDTLTVICNIFPYQNQRNSINDFGFCLLRTRIDAECTVFTWNIDKFSTLSAGDQRSILLQLFSNQHISVQLTLLLTDDLGSLTAESNIKMELKGTNKGKSCYLMLAISVQDKNDESVHQFREELKLKKESEKLYWSFLLKKEQLIEAEGPLFTGDVLSLKCEMVAYDVVFNRRELSVFGHNAKFLLRAALSNTNPLFHLGKRKRLSNSLTNDLKYLLEDKQHADISLRVKTETFHVHRAILTARSSVFKAMFDTDMKEKFTNTIEVSDIEPDTMRRLLLYIYSENWDSDIQWENVSSLYLAADKYSVLGLKEKCSSYLQANISTTNLSETLVFADTMGDSELKDFAVNFIQDKNEQVINSDEWKNFALEHPQLSIDILTRLYKKVKRF